MRVREQAGQVPVLTLVEHEYSRRGTYHRRWVVLDERGMQSALQFHRFEEAVDFVAHQQEAWRIWTAEALPLGR